MDDFALVGIVFLLLVVLGKQPFAALVGSGSNGGLSAAPLYDSYVKVRAWQRCDLLSPDSGHGKSRESFKDFLLFRAAGGRRLFGF